MARWVGLYVFADEYLLEPGSEGDMMSQAFTRIRNSSILVAEVSNKAIGVGIEIGYAVALGIPVVYLRNTISEYSLTVGGAADGIIVYTDAEDLERLLRKTLPIMLQAGRECQ